MTYPNVIVGHHLLHTIIVFVVIFWIFVTYLPWNHFLFVNDIAHQIKVHTYFIVKNGLNGTNKCVLSSWYYVKVHFIWYISIFIYHTVKNVALNEAENIVKKFCNKALSCLHFIIFCDDINLILSSINLKSNVMQSFLTKISMIISRIFSLQSYF